MSADEIDDAMQAALGERFARVNGAGAAAVSPALRYWTLEEALADAELMAPPVPVVAPLAYAGRVTVLSAREKMGKSTLCGDVVAALSHGRPFFRGDAQPPSVVLWYAVDEPLSDAVRRLAAADAHVGEGRIILSPERPTPAELIAKITETGAHLVIVDTLSELWRGHVDKDADAGQVAGFLRPYVDVARTTGAALLFLYHTSKAGQEYRGSVALGATVDAVLTLRPVRPGTFGAGTPATPDAGGDGEDVDDDGRRLLIGRTRWGFVREELAFDGTRYTLGDAPLPLSLRALRAIGDGLATSGKALAPVLGVRAERALALVTELTHAGQVTRRGSHAPLTLTPVGVKAAAGSGDGSRAASAAPTGTDAGTGRMGERGTAEPPGNPTGTDAELSDDTAGTDDRATVPDDTPLGPGHGNRVPDAPAELGIFGPDGDGDAP